MRKEHEADCYDSQRFDAAFRSVLEHKKNRHQQENIDGNSDYEQLIPLNIGKKDHQRHGDVADQNGRAVSERQGFDSEISDIGRREKYSLKAAKHKNPKKTKDTILLKANASMKTATIHHQVMVRFLISSAKGDFLLSSNLHTTEKTIKSPTIAVMT